MTEKKNKAEGITFEKATVYKYGELLVLTPEEAKWLDATYEYLTLSGPLAATLGDLELEMDEDDGAIYIGRDGVVGSMPLMPQALVALRELLSPQKRG